MFHGNFQKDLVHLALSRSYVLRDPIGALCWHFLPGGGDQRGKSPRTDALTSLGGGQRWTRRLASGVRRHKYSQRTWSFKAASQPGVQRGIPFEGTPTQITAGQKVIMGSAVILSGLRGQAGHKDGGGAVWRGWQCGDFESNWRWLSRYIESLG